MVSELPKTGTHVAQKTDMMRVGSVVKIVPLLSPTYSGHARYFDGEKGVIKGRTMTMGGAVIAGEWTVMLLDGRQFWFKEDELEEIG